ncbi:ABC transporter substrate-binding protein [Pseudooceanicola sediminis]|uniref:ABC transporter substrate-binding protein n=1 Tax=Pseudooceanicola sediminis TaxID=2211117 RepID=A0A399J0F9_9RHOB|nr:ABC transporter substrate-binding protein [Pseudooceanicola sediminis]KAA2313910.1 ABC transporter substrate-binding protein [Puniceibacterium sp. HSS470]RII38724.1 ABC transporter substrate-binding protein [Pseudooceanicola sediminis]|tara:strand:+ start:34511 stop:35596 length:1086 start_codon:yes stop_codon:yes gene_type:complete
MKRTSKSLLGLVAFAGLALPADAQDLKPVTVTVGTSVLNVGYPMLTLPVTLGYWADEGYDVTVEPSGASMQALQQMVTRNAEFAQVNASVAVQSNVENDLPVRIAMANGVMDWSIAVPKDSDITSVADLKGKTFGIFSLATGGLPLLKSYLSDNGIDPETDVTYIPTGFGAGPVEALKNGQVDALMYWASANAGMENAGLDLRYIFDDSWREMPDYSLTVTEATVKDDPDMVVAISRGVAMATVFALANPECAVKLHWQEYPETKPAGTDEAAILQADLNNINAQLNTLKLGYELNGETWGQVDTDALDRLQDFLTNSGIVSKKIDPATYLVDIPDFAARVSDFDADAIKASAEACEMLKG